MQEMCIGLSLRQMCSGSRAQVQGMLSGMPMLQGQVLQNLMHQVMHSGLPMHQVPFQVPQVPLHVHHEVLQGMLRCVLVQQSRMCLHISKHIVRVRLCLPQVLWLGVWLLPLRGNDSRGEDVLGKACFQRNAHAADTVPLDPPMLDSAHETHKACSTNATKHSRSPCSLHLLPQEYEGEHCVCGRC